MDLITYLKNTENEELIKKLKEIVKLYKEREENHKELIDLNKEYNEFLTKKHEKESNGKDNKDNITFKPTSLTPFFLFFILIMLPIPIAIIAYISLNLFALVKLVKEKNKIKDKMANKLINNIRNGFEDFKQDIEYEELCKVRQTYHTKRKELDEAILNISKSEIELIDDFYGAIAEYDTLLELLTTNLDNVEELTQTGPSTQPKELLITNHN